MQLTAPYSDLSPEDYDLWMTMARKHQGIDTPFTPTAPETPEPSTAQPPTFPALFWDHQTDSPTKITEYMSVILFIWWMFWFIMAICVCFDSLPVAFPRFIMAICVCFDGLGNVPVPYSTMSMVALFYLWALWR